MKKCILLLLFLTSILCVYDILQFGAIPNSDTLQSQLKNSQAILKAINFANNTQQGQRSVRIPNKKFYSMPIRIQNVHNITIQIYGKLLASQNIAHWPRLPQMQKFYEDFFSFRNSNHIQIKGGGKIDGRGYPWWVILFHNNKKILPDQNGRPMLLHFINCNHTLIHDLTLKNSPQFHLKYDQCHDGTAYNIDIKVNTTAQISLVNYFKYRGYPIMFPFNTDGIDPSGQRFHIYNLTCQNFDDVIVTKPLNDGDFQCSQDMIFENVTAFLGIGMSIGSLSPSAGRDCIRNVYAFNWRMIRPIKSIYVKSNPGHEGTGIIQNLIFRNFTMDRPIWWCIYIGPQQMKQPDGDGPGCMFYPFGKGVCETQPRVTMRNITVENIRIHNSLFFPYTIRCNVTNPCRDINFYNVRTDRWLVGQKQTGYMCQYVFGKGRGNVPKIHCLDDVDQNGEVIQEFEEEVLQEKRRNVFEWAYDQSLSAYKVSKMMFDELKKAVHEIGYHEQDDEVDHHISPSALYLKIERQFTKK